MTICCHINYFKRGRQNQIFIYFYHNIFRIKVLMFNEEVSEIKIDPIVIAKYQKICVNSTKSRDWLKLLNCYIENNDFQGISETFNAIHKRFCLTQQQWSNEIDRLFKAWQTKKNQTEEMKKWFNNGLANHQQETEQKNLLDVKQVISISMMALEDGFFFAVARKIADFIIVLLKDNKLKINFSLAQIQKIISLFQHDIKKGGFFFGKLRQIYAVQNNVDKIRESFIREVKGSYQNMDVTYDSYNDWENQIKEMHDTSLQIFSERVKKMKEIYELAKMKWEVQNQYIQEKQIQLMNPKAALSMIDQESGFYKEKYKQLLSRLETEKQRLWFLRRTVLKRGELIHQYLYKLQITSQGNPQAEQNLKQQYKFLAQKFTHCQILYLRYLNRRMSKHLHCTQSEQYNQSWGQKVVQFRQAITQFIQKERFSVEDQIKYMDLYYNFWFQVQIRIVKDIDSVKDLYKSRITQISSQKKGELVVIYAQAMASLGDYKQAKSCLKRFRDMFFIYPGMVNALTELLQIYGVASELQQFQQLKQRNFSDPKQKTPKQNIIHPTNSVLPHLHHSSFKSLHADQVKMTYDQIPFDIHSSNGTHNKGIPNQGATKKDIQTKEVNFNQKQNQEKIITEIRAKNEVKVTKQNKQQDREAQQTQKKIDAAQRKRYHSDSGNTLFIQNIPQSWKQSDVISILKNQQSVKEIRIIQKNKTYNCYIQFSTPEIAQKQCNENQSSYRMMLSRPPSQFDQSRTLFVCALPTTVTQDKIRQLFQGHQGSIRQIRMKIKNDKHHAYVDFCSKEQKEKVFESLKSSKMVIDGKKIIVQQCDSDRMRSKKFMKVAFIKNLAFKAKQEDIIKFFDPRQIKQVLIPKGDNNRTSRGIAYVQFQKFKDFQQALDMKHGNICGRQFSIFKSDRQITKATNEYDGSNISQHSKQHRYNKRQRKQDKGNQYFSNLFK